MSIEILIQDNHYDRSSQAFGVATELIYIPSQTDYFIEPKKYETYDERCKRIDLLGKVKLIQRNFRRYLWQKLIRESAAEWRSVDVLKLESITFIQNLFSALFYVQ